MTTYANDECKCAVCGEINEYWEFGSATTFSGPDLDLRPAEMLRGTMREWIQSCPKCGYVSSSISDPTSVTREWLKSKKYFRCDGIPFSSGLARRFYRYYLISLEDKKLKNAFFAVLHAAWAFDDVEDEENAKRCREIAIPLATSLIEEDVEDANAIQQIRDDLMCRMSECDELDEAWVEEVLQFKIAERHKDQNNIRLIMADLMRRAGQFDELINAYSSVHFDDELLNQIIEFQIEKARENDTACYRVEDVTGEED